MADTVLSEILNLKGQSCDALWRWMAIDMKESRLMLKFLALNQGCRVNYSSISHELGICRSVAKRQIRALAASGLIRLLYQLPDEMLGDSPRISRPAAPTQYFRDTALLLEALSIEDGEDLPNSILGDRLFAAYMLERIVATELQIYPDSRFFCYGGYTSAPVELIVVRADTCFGLVFRFKNYLRGADWRSLKAARKHNLISRGFALHTGLRGYCDTRDVLAVNGLYFRKDYTFLTDPAQKRCPLLLRVARNNRRYPADVLRADAYPRHANRLLL